MIIKFVRRTVIFLLVLLLVLMAAQLGAAYFFSRPGRAVKPAELLVVFPGEQQRLLSGCDLAAEGLAPILMVVSLPANQLAEICSRHNDPPAGGTTRTISSAKSRSTFEDVYNTITAIERYNITSVILVTSAYHLPRAMFLLKTSLALKGRDVTVQFHPVAAELALRRKLRLYFNEYAKLFGSTAEMTWYFSTGHLMLDSPRLRELRAFLKNHLLFFYSNKEPATD
ncbi:MAG: YdcF family protein [Desulforhopalus sp.]